MLQKEFKKGAPKSGVFPPRQTISITLGMESVTLQAWIRKLWPKRGECGPPSKAITKLMDVQHTIQRL
jgi:hypothetical protein